MSAACGRTDISCVRVLVDYPANRFFIKCGKLGIFPCPMHHAFCGINMADGSSRGSCGKGCAAGIGKKVEDTNFSSLFFCGSYLFTHHIPVHSLFREKPRMLEAGGAYFEGEVFIIYLPEFRKFPAEFPMSAACGRTDISCVRVLPHGMFLRGVPYNLGVWSYKNDFSPAFKSFAAGTIEQFIIFPVFCISHF